jgi:hypothetical protein
MTERVRGRKKGKYGGEGEIENSREKFMAKFIFNLILIALTSLSLILSISLSLTTYIYDNVDNHLLLKHPGARRGAISISRLINDSSNCAEVISSKKISCSSSMYLTSP